MPPPSLCRMPVAAGLRYSEQGLSRGNRARSTSRTDAPARAHRRAVVAPAGPAPTITASQRSVTRWSWLWRRQAQPKGAHGGARHSGREVHRVVVEPSPTPHEPHRLVTHRLSAFESRVASGTLVLALQRR